MLYTWVSKIFKNSKNRFVWQSVNCRGIKLYLQAVNFERSHSSLSRQKADVLSDLFQLWVGFCCLKVSFSLNWNYLGKRKCLAYLRLVTMKSSQLIFQMRRTEPVWVFVSVIINSNWHFREALARHALGRLGFLKLTLEMLVNISFKL